MGETTADVRRDIEMTRERMSGTLAELERKLDVAEIVRDHPWASLALAIGAGFLLADSNRDIKAAAATVAATKLGAALDDVVGTLVGGVHQALDDRVNGWVGELKDALGATSSSRSSSPVASIPPRAD
jgi:uncharacterized protein DUF3618